MIFVAMDDTDNVGTRGTGKLSRDVAEELSRKYPIKGIVRHQLLVHPDVPYTSHNSCAVIHIDINIDNLSSYEGFEKYEKNPDELLKEIFNDTKKEMLNDFIDGSDPGLAVAADIQVTTPLVAFAKDAKEIIVTQGQARGLARNLGILLEGFGGTEDGVIGAMAGIGLSSTYNDGRYIRVRDVPKLKGSQVVESLLNAGIDKVVSKNGETINKKDTITNKDNKDYKPSPLNGEVALLVEIIRGEMHPIKRS